MYNVLNDWLSQFLSTAWIFHSKERFQLSFCLGKSNVILRQIFNNYQVRKISF